VYKFSSGVLEYLYSVTNYICDANYIQRVCNVGSLFFFPVAPSEAGYNLCQLISYIKPGTLTVLLMNVEYHSYIVSYRYEIVQVYCKPDPKLSNEQIISEHLVMKRVFRL
jgi:hypothetical protein